MRRKSGAIGAAASIRTSCDCDSGNLRAITLEADPMHAPRVEQPVVHDLPLVPAPCLEIQQCRSRVLQLYKELQRISTGRGTGIDGLRLDPLIPFPDDQTPRSFLFHRLRQTQKRPPGGGLSAVALMGKQVRLRERPRPPIMITQAPSCNLSATRGVVESKCRLDERNRTAVARTTQHAFQLSPIARLKADRGRRAASATFLA